MIDLNNIFKSIKSIICLNGAIPSKDYFTRTPHLPIIAADGAGSELIKMGIIPNLIVGDLDSIDKEILGAYTDIICIPDQNSTDFEKTLLIVRERNLFPCLIYGATGQESDHTLYNLNIMAEYSQHYKIIFHDSACDTKEKYGIFVRDTLIGELDINSKISLLSFTSAIVSSEGLMWDLTNMQLSPKVSSTRNAIKSSKFKITIHNGNALVIFDTQPM